MKIKRTDIDASGQTDGYVLSVSGGKLVFSAPATGGGTSGVTSVNGKTGAVTLTGTDLTITGPALVGRTASTSGTTTALSVNTVRSFLGLANVAITAAYSDLVGAPTLSEVAISGSYTDLVNAPALAAVATTGSYNSLTNKPTFIAPRVAVVTGVSGSYNVDWSLYDTVELQLTGNVTLTFSGAVSGQKMTLKIKQDATGSRTVSLPNTVRFGTDFTSYVATTTPSKKDYVGLQYDAADTKYDLLSAAKGF